MYGLEFRVEGLRWFRAEMQRSSGKVGPPHTDADRNHILV